MVDQLREHGLAEEQPGPVEPGGDREAVRPRPGQRPGAEPDRLQRVSRPRAVFRIDHYLGKETVQNLMALRFANQLFEPVWNNNYVDHVQITMAEDIGIGGRAGYFDGIGIARDVIQNHLLQLLALTAMEEPTSFEARQLRAEKQKVLAAARPPKRMDLHTARGAVRRRLGRRREGRAATWRRTGSRQTPRPRRTPRSGSTSTTGAGPACRSTCAPASGWPGGSPRSRSGSSRHRTCRSPRPTPRSSATTPWCCGSSRTRA